MSDERDPSKKLDFEIIGYGAATPVGMTAGTTAAAVRAGVAMFREHPAFFVDRSREQAIVAACSWLDKRLPVTDRLVALATQAAQEARVTAPDSPVFLGLPEPRPGLSQEQLDEVATRLTNDLGGQVQTFPSGHAAGFQALDAARVAVAKGKADTCLVGGVDSYLDWRTILWLDKNDQLHSHSYSWGFIPGEAAGFIAVKRVEQGGDDNSFPKILGLGLAKEENRIKTETVCTGEALGQAMRDAVAGVEGDGPIVEHLIGDLNGEPYRADEFGFSLMRLRQRVVEGIEFATPAGCWGDVGAASAPLFLMLAAIAAEKGYAPGNRTLCWAGSEGGLRGAALLETKTKEGR